MRLLPAEKVPKLNTDGEKYRDQQLVYQLPKQDLSLKYCHHVEAPHHTSFQDFVCARNDIALDVGHAVDGVTERSNGSAIPSSTRAAVILFRQAFMKNM